MTMSYLDEALRNASELGWAVLPVAAGVERVSLALRSGWRTYIDFWTLSILSISSISQTLEKMKRKLSGNKKNESLEKCKNR